MSYQGPHAAVTQKFVTSPVGISIDSLPPTAIATAFDVFTKGNLGSHYGIVNQQLAWIDEDGESVDKVVYDENVISQRAYDFYPVEAYANAIDSDGVDLELASSKIASAGVTIDLDKDYSLPGIARTSGTQAYIPFYNKTAEELVSGTTTGTTIANHLIDSGETFSTVNIGDIVENTTDDTYATVTNVAANDLTLDSDIMTSGEDYTISKAIKLESTGKQEITIPDGTVVSARLEPGQNVIVRRSTTWTLLGTVGSVGPGETTIKLAVPYSSAVSAAQIVIGSAGVDSAVRLIPNTLVTNDTSTDFSSIEVGDILNISSLSISGSGTTPIEASVVSKPVNNRKIIFNTVLLTQAGRIDYNFSQYKAFPVASAPGATIDVSAYDVKRLVGFSQNYGMKEIGTPDEGVTVTKVSDSVFTIPKTVDSETVPSLLAGDVIGLTQALVDGSTNERAVSGLNLYKIATVKDDTTVWTITVNDTIKNDADTTFDTGDYLNAWNPKIETDILVNFRAVREENAGSVVKISKRQDIYDAFVKSGHDITPWNELAFMLDIQFIRAGLNKACYGVNVDATANLSSQYADALEELTLIDSYCHVFGTTDAAVNALMAPYCNAESEPYQGHEKIGIVCYDQDSVYKQGEDTGSMDSAGLITTTGAFNVMTGGVSINDHVDVYNSSGVFQETLTVEEIPSASNTVQTNGDESYAAGTTFVFMSGRKDDQAQRIAALGAGERRVTVVWPGWFYAEYDGERYLMPPYFLTAAISGMDASFSASQSFTNLDFAVPGLSNIELGTNSYFKKSQLDVIGGGGIDIMIQDQSISSIIKSRHDLTSNMDAIQFRERSITKQADVTAKTLRNSVKPYVGKYNITDQLLSFLGQVVAVAKSELTSNSIILKLTLRGIERDEVIDDKINIYVTATAFIAGNYYDIELLVKTR